MKNSSETPLVSIIVTTYNRKDLLNETLHSILGQTHQHFELIVVDNFSDYDFPAFMQTYEDERIRWFQNQNHGVIAVNRNFGIRQAGGNYIAFCDDDDLWKPEKIEKQLEHFSDNVVGVGSTTIHFTDTVNKCTANSNLNNDVFLDFERLVKIRSAPLSSLIVKNYGMLFDEDPGFMTAEDFDFQLRLTLQTEKYIKLLAVPYVYYRTHPETNLGKIEYRENIFNVIKKYEDQLSDNLIKIRRFNKYYSIGKKYYSLSDYYKSSEYFKNSLRNFPFSNYKKLGKLLFFMLISKVMSKLHDKQCKVQSS